MLDGGLMEFKKEPLRFFEFARWLGLEGAISGRF